MKTLFFLALTGLPLSAANVVSTWNRPGGGAWAESANWTNAPGVGAFPNNGTDSFDAIIGLSVGGAAEVSISLPVTVNNLTLSSNLIKLTQVGVPVQVVNALTISSSTFELTAGSIQLSGSSLKLAGGTLAPTNMTLNGGAVVGGSITTTGAGQLHCTAANANALDNVALVGGLVLDQANGQVRLRNDATFGASDATLTGNSAVLATQINLNGINGFVSFDGSLPALTVTPVGVIRAGEISV